MARRQCGAQRCRNPEGATPPGLLEAQRSASAVGSRLMRRRERALTTRLVRGHMAHVTLDFFGVWQMQSEECGEAGARTAGACMGGRGIDAGEGVDVGGGAVGTSGHI